MTPEIQPAPDLAPTAHPTGKPTAGPDPDIVLPVADTPPVVAAPAVALPEPPVVGLLDPRAVHPAPEVVQPAIGPVGR